LDLSETAVELVPENLGNLVYLKYLNLSSTRIQAIPESIGNLWNLEFLLLRDCKSLHKLPKGIEHLRGLRDLDQAGTVIDYAAFSVGHLRCLTPLQCFAVTSKEA
jgi:Leucine-rich repeat (LRR) protein